MRIVAADPHPVQGVAAGLGVEVLSLEAALAQADVVVIACFLDDTTRHLINAGRLAHMKASAVIVNVARGPIIDERALIEALRSGALAGAGLDVFEQEPPDPANPLFAMDNVIATPHSLCWTDRFLEDVARSALQSIVDVLQGRLPEHIVNREALGHSRVLQWSSDAGS